MHWQGEIEFLDNVIHSSSDLGDTLFTMDITAITPTLDNNINGVTFDGTHLWIAGANAAAGTPQIYKFDRSGNFLQTISQPVVTGNYFGFSNLVTDGVFLYGDLNNDIYVIDLQSGGLIRVTTLPNLSRVDAFTLDRSALDYWATTWSESIYQFDTNGALLSVFPYSGPAIGGLALEPDATIPRRLWAWRESRHGPR